MSGISIKSSDTPARPKSSLGYTSAATPSKPRSTSTRNIQQPNPTTTSASPPKVELPRRPSSRLATTPSRSNSTSISKTPTASNLNTKPKEKLVVKERDKSPTRTKESAPSKSKPAKKEKKKDNVPELKKQIEKELSTNAGNNTPDDLEIIQVDLQEAQNTNQENSESTEDLKDLVHSSEIIVADPQAIAPFLKYGKILKWMQLTEFSPNKILQQMAEDKIEAEQKKQESLNLQRQLEEEQKQIQQEKDSMNNQLIEAQVAMDRAKSAVQLIKKSDLEEIRTLKSPPPMIQMCMEVVHTMLLHATPESKTELDWDKIKQLSARTDFVANILNFDAVKTMDPPFVAKLKKDYLNKPEFTLQSVKRASVACGPLYEWIIAQTQYASVYIDLSPLREKITNLEKQATKLQKQLDDNLTLIHQAENPEFVLTRLGGPSFGLAAAEYMLSHILFIERKLQQIQLSQKDKDWNTALFSNIRPLSSLTVGILAVEDEASQAVCKYFRDIRTKVVCCYSGSPARKNSVASGPPITLTPAPSKQRPKSQTLSPEVIPVESVEDQSYAVSDMDKFLSQCDYVVNLLPDTPQTTGILDNEDILSKSKKDLVYFGIGSASVISEQSLMTALDKKYWSQAILDNFTQCPLPQDSPLWTHSQVTVTPRIAMPVTPTDIAQIVKHNYFNWKSGQPLRHQVKVS